MPWIYQERRLLSQGDRRVAFQWTTDIKELRSYEKVKLTQKCNLLTRKTDQRLCTNVAV